MYNVAFFMRAIVSCLGNCSFWIEFTLKLWKRRPYAHNRKLLSTFAWYSCISHCIAMREIWNATFMRGIFWDFQLFVRNYSWVCIYARLIEVMIKSDLCLLIRCCINLCIFYTHDFGTNKIKIEILYIHIHIWFHKFVDYIFLCS